MRTDKWSIRFVLAVQLLLILAFLLPVAFCMAIPRTTSKLEALAAWLVVFYSSLRLALLALKGERNLLSLTFWVFVYVWLGLAPMLQLMTGEFPQRGTYGTATALWSVALVLVGLAMYDLGYALASIYAPRAPWLPRAFSSRVASSGRTIAIGLAGSVVTLALVQSLGGLAGIVVSRWELVTRVREIVGDAGAAQLLLFNTFLRVPVFIALYVSLMLWRHRRAGPALVGAVLVLSVLNLAVNNPLNSPRFWFGTVLLGLALALVPWQKSYTFSLWALGIVLALVLVFPYADLFRATIEPDVTRVESWRLLVEKADYDAFQQVMNAVLHVSDEGLSYGKQFLGTSLFWIPRTVWPDKPVSSGELVAETSGYQYTNLSFPLWAEAYIDGGILALMLVFLLYGFGTARLELAFVREQPRNLTFLSLVVPIYAAYQFFLLRGALMSAFAYFIPIIGLLLLCTIPKQSQAAGMEPDELASADRRLARSLQNLRGLTQHGR